VGAGAVPNSDQQLAICHLLDEGADYKNLGQLPRIHISPFSRVTKERRVPQREGHLLMPFSQILGEIVDEAGLKNPEYSRFGERKEVSDHSEGSFVFLLK